MLILTLLVATLIVVICFICLLYFVANVLDKRYVIVLIDNSYQLIDANTLENYVDNVNNVLDIDERNYLDITLISFSLFIIYLFACTHKENKNFFDKYFNKHYDTIVY
jgi:hypothetical protein|nr:MAG TPA: hypothetical protein [Caudoviricetes sp.]